MTSKEIRKFIVDHPDQTLEEIIMLYKAGADDVDGVEKVRTKLNNGGIISNYTLD